MHTFRKLENPPIFDLNTNLHIAIVYKDLTHQRYLQKPSSKTQISSGASLGRSPFVEASVGASTQQIFPTNSLEPPNLFFHRFFGVRNYMDVSSENRGLVFFFPPKHPWINRLFQWCSPSILGFSPYDWKQPCESWWIQGTFSLIFCW